MAAEATQNGWMRKRHTGLLAERSSYDSHVDQVAQNLLPRIGRLRNKERNQGGKRNSAIIDSTGTQSLRVMTAGLMAGMTSPARPWFRLSVPNPDLQKDHEVRKWLYDCTQIVARVFAKSNTYNALHFMYRELGFAGTAFSLVDDNFQNVIHHNALTFGEYAIGLDQYATTDAVSREFVLTVDQAARQFGLEKLSMSAQNDYERGNYTREIDILQIVEPRPLDERTPGKLDARNMAYRSVYAEMGREGRLTGPDYLRESGYRFFPGLGPRWDVLYNDNYGFSPGMDALGDLLHLQQQQFSKAKAIDYQSDPPLQVPTTLRNTGADLLPGGVSYFDGNAQNGIRSAFEVKLDLNYLTADIGEVQRRINSAFYADIFLMLATADRTNMTATEIAERHEEKLLMLGPVLERLHGELLAPLVTSTFTRCIEAGILPPTPEQLGGMPLDIEFVSMLAQAQRAVGVNSVDRLVSHIGVLANAKTDVVDNFDADKSVQEYADMLGVNPDLIVPSEQVTLVRQQRAEQLRQQAALEQANMAADAAGKLGGIQTGAAAGENAASDILNLFSGYQTPSAVEV